MQIYGYHRTSTKEQHLDRGIQEIERYCNEHEMALTNPIQSRGQKGICTVSQLAQFHRCS